MLARPMPSPLAILVAAEALLLHFVHPGHVYRGGPALVDARGLGLGDALKLALPAKITQKNKISNL